MSETGPVYYHEARSHGDGWRPAGHSDPSQYAINERQTSSCSRCDRILTRPGVPRIFAALTRKREARGVEKAVCDRTTRKSGVIEGQGTEPG